MKKQLSKQRRWQLKKKAQGLCVNCGGQLTVIKKKRCMKCWPKRH